MACKKDDLPDHDTTPPVYRTVKYEVSLLDGGDVGYTIANGDQVDSTIGNYWEYEFQGEVGLVIELEGVNSTFTIGEDSLAIIKLFIDGVLDTTCISSPFVNAAILNTTLK